ncbi:MAG: N-acetylmuramoyl-L-alanine amidase [Gemmatimonadales bacterium]
MIVLALAVTLLAGPARPPASLTVATPRGEARLAVRYDATGAPVLPAQALAVALGATLRTADPWLDLVIARQNFRFLLDAPYYVFQGTPRPMAATASRMRDTLYLPFQFVVEVLPALFSERFQYDARASRLTEVGAPARRLPNGLLPGHVVTVDPGHGGIDPGNPGLYFPRGVREKDVTLQVGLLLRKELQERGITVVMTRTSDTLIAVRDRGGFCADNCDLFVSLHVDALDPRGRRDYRSVSGFTSLIIGEENTADADRVARMENEALRFEGPSARQADVGSLEFMLKDLQMNEFLRESAQAASLIQTSVDKIHSGTNRGVKQSNRLAVLNTARRPAVLFEMGYATNTQDARLLTRRKSQEALAAAIADAIVDYLHEYERKIGAEAR